MKIQININNELNDREMVKQLVQQPSILAGFRGVSERTITTTVTRTCFSPIILYNESCRILRNANCILL